jgi:vitamin B12 transporter
MAHAALFTGGSMHYPSTARCLALSACLVALPVAAADGNTPIIVTATRVAQTADETLASVTVITREDIERSQAGSITEVLRGRTGIDIATQGGAGQLSSVFMRGTNPGHVALLVDGIRMGSVTAGRVSWEFIPLQQVERIEIVRGPNSALYGSEAIGGVIQIFTRRGKGPLQWGAMAGGGRYNTREAALDFSGSDNNNWYSGQLSRLETDGFDARDPAMVFTEFVNEPDHDGHDNTSLSLRAGHRFPGGSELEFHGLHAEGNVEYDNTDQQPDEDDFVQQALGVSLRTPLTEFLNLTATAGRSLDERNSFRSGVQDSKYHFDSERRSFSLQGDYSSSDADIFTLGLDYHDDRVDSTTAYNETSRYTQAVFAQYRGERGSHSLLARIRPLDDEQFGSHTTGNLAWGYQLDATTRLVASWGTAYKAPTFNDLYFPEFMGFQTSNPDLDPEESETLELGAEGHTGGIDWDLRIFRTRIDNLIVFDLATFLPANVNEATIEGLEASLSGDLYGWTTRTSATFLNPRDDSTGNILPRRAKRSFRLDIDRLFGKAGFGGSFIVQSSRFDDQGNTVSLGGYGLLDLRASWKLGRNWQLQGRVENAFDKHYRTVDTYNTAGRSLFMTLRYRAGE